MYLTTDRDSVEPQRVIASSKFGVSICNWYIPLNPFVGTIYTVYAVYSSSLGAEKIAIPS